jgi:proteasome alpha subunit
MFSPEGRLFQVEYALEAVRRGTLAVGIKSKAGAVIIIRKKLSTKLMDPGSIHKIFKIDKHIGGAISGLHADSRRLVDWSRVQCQINRLNFDEPVPLRTLVRKIADIKQQYTQHAGVRPFGSALLLIAVDIDGSQLMTTSPSGVYFTWKATALGVNEDTAKKILKENYNEDMTMDELMKLGIKVQKECSDDELVAEDIEIAFVEIEEKEFKTAEQEKINGLFDAA